MSTKIFTITHKPFTPPKDSLYVPLHVGRALTENLGYLGDDTGDSISHLNPYFCELTGMYWLWKNYHEADIIGICHYRRYLINESGAVFTEIEVQKLLEQYDILTSKLLTLPKPYYEGFSANHHRKDLIAVSNVIKQKYPEYFPVFDTLVHGPHTYFGNIFITDKKTYDRYCSWLFDILFEVQKQTDFSGYNNYQKRLFGFLSEFLQTVWIRYHRLKVCECMVGMIGEKYETKKLREQLASYFEARDYAAAKACFLECYEKRPDVLMEASDVNGELRLCMQIISTCEFEDAAYGQCILDKIHDYPSLINHFSRLNEVVLDYVNHSSVTSFVSSYVDDSSYVNYNYLKQNPFLTPVAVEIAVTLFCENANLREKIYEEICRICSFQEN